MNSRSCLLAALAAAIVHAQPAASKFEVASIKRCPENRRVPGTALLDTAPGRLTINCAPVSFMIETAYHTNANGRDNANWQMRVEGPAWIRTEFYQVEAKAEDPAATAVAMGGAMLRDLLEDRLKLKLHSTMIEIPVYAVTLAKDDSKLRAFEDRTCNPCAGLKFSRNGTRTTLTAEGASLDDFYRLQALAVNRPVINRTGIAGSYTFQLEFAREPAPGTPLTAEPVGPSIFDALERVLGLKLEDAKGPSEILTVDSVERPSDN